MDHDVVVMGAWTIKLAGEMDGLGSGVPTVLICKVKHGGFKDMYPEDHLAPFLKVWVNVGGFVLLGCIGTHHRANGCNSGKKIMAVRIIKQTMEIIYLTNANSIQIIIDAIIHMATEEGMLLFCLFSALTMVVQRVRHVVHLTLVVQRVPHVVHDRSM